MSTPATTPAAPKKEARYNAETRAELDRQYQAWLHSARPIDSDWGLTHAKIEPKQLEAK